MALVALASVVVGCGEPERQPVPVAMDEDEYRDWLYEESAKLETPEGQRDPLGCSVITPAEMAVLFPEIDGVRSFVFEDRAGSICEWYDAGIGGVAIAARVLWEWDGDCGSWYPNPTGRSADGALTLKRHPLGVVGWRELDDADGRSVCLIAIDNLSAGDERLGELGLLVAAAVAPGSEPSIEPSTG